jgi:hypothetical protein
VPRQIATVVVRGLAILFGLLLTVVQRTSFAQLPLPVTAEAVGFDIAWVCLFAAGLWLLSYGFGIKLTRRS